MIYGQQTTVPGLSYDVVCVILRSAILVEHFDLWQMDGHTMTAYTALA